MVGGWVGVGGGVGGGGGVSMDTLHGRLPAGLFPHVNTTYTMFSIQKVLYIAYSHTV